jgi:hypothetical protein
VSDPVFELATKWLSVPTEDQDPATTFAKAFKSERERVVELERVCAEVNKRLNAKTHECEALASKHTEVVQAMKCTPEYSRQCVNTQCETVLIRQVAPPEEATERWLRGLGWGDDGQCPECRRGK